MVGLDPINNFHLHGTLYKYYPTGTDMVPSEFADMTTFSQSERGILEFEYEYTGRYMFHAHLTEFSEKGWSGVFYVKDSSQPNMEGYAYGS
jgi:FtsP/CotA-like multicopper oxidase with cupredoxin domain